MSPELSELIEIVRKLPPMTAEQRRAQAISFVYGNCSLANPRITPEMVEAQMEKMRNGQAPALAYEVDP